MCSLFLMEYVEVVLCLTDSVIFSDDVLNAVLCNSGELIALVDTRFLKLGVCGTCSKLLHLC